MGVGDEILAAGQAQRLYDADPSARVAICDPQGRPRWHDIWRGNPIIASPADVAAGERYHCVINAPHARPYIVYPFTKESGWTFNPHFKARHHRARIYLTPEEEHEARDIRAGTGPYVLVEPFTKHDNFRWPMDRWAALVAACPDLTFIQHTHADSVRIPGAYCQPATFRQACALAKYADCYVRSESGMCHAAAALEVPQVTLFGGCMDAEVMGYYPGQTVIADTGPGSPCGRWLPCDHCRACMDRITVEDVVTALRARVAGRKAA